MEARLEELGDRRPQVAAGDAFAGAARRCRAELNRPAGIRRERRVVERRVHDASSSSLPAGGESGGAWQIVAEAAEVRAARAESDAGRAGEDRRGGFDEHATPRHGRNEIELLQANGAAEPRAPGNKSPSGGSASGCPRRRREGRDAIAEGMFAQLTSCRRRARAGRRGAVSRSSAVQPSTALVARGPAEARGKLSRARRRMTAEQKLDPARQARTCS